MRSFSRLFITTATRWISLLMLSAITFAALIGFIPQLFDTSAANGNAGAPAEILSLGNYPPASVELSGNTVVLPDAAPVGVASLTVSTNTNFKGRFEGDPNTGTVRITNAHPEGQYPVTVTADGPGGRATATFTLTVDTTLSCNEITFSTGAGVPVGTNPRSTAVGDFNKDGL